MINYKINFKNSAFKSKFKREPKRWSLQDIQGLLDRATDRFNKRKEIIKKVINKVVDEIPTTKIGNSEYKLVYYRHNNQVYKYEFSWNYQFNSWSWSSGLVEFSNDKQKRRQEKIDFILSNQRAFELGEEFKKVDRLRTNLHFRVKSIFIGLIEDKLRERFRGAKFMNEIIQVKVKDKLYYFECEDSGYYKKFKYKGEVKDEVIELC